MRFWVALFSVLLSLTLPLLAQTPPSAITQSLQGQAEPPPDIQPLIDALKDDTTRQALIDALEKEQALQASSSTSETSAGATDSGDGSNGSASPTIGDRVLTTAPEIATDFFQQVHLAWDGLRLNIRRLGGLGDIDKSEAQEMLSDTFWMVLASFGIFIGGQFALRPVYRRIDASAAGSTPAHRLLMSVLSIAIHLCLLLVATVAALAISGQEPGAQTANMRHIYYSVAFFFAGGLTIALGAVLRPISPHIRPVPLSDATARYWFWNLFAVIAIVAFGEIYFRRAVEQMTSAATAEAVTVMIHIIAAAYLATLLVVNRRRPAEWLANLSEANPDSAQYAILASLGRYWYFAVLAIVGFMLYRATISEDELAVAQLVRLGIVIISLAATILIVSLLNRYARRGVNVSAGIARAMPNLDPRLDAFIPSFLRFLRYVVIVFWFGFALQTLGFAQPWNWLEARFGLDLASATTSLIVIVVVGYAIWLSVTSWIDYRLTPKDGHDPSPREQTLFALMRNAALVAILLLGMTYGLAAVGISVAPLLASAGVIGLAIGFGSQKLVQDIINGLFIQFENAINVGDVVELAGLIGTVEKLTIRSVSLRDVQGVLHVVPFSSVDAVSNHMKGFSYHLADIDVAYGSDLDLAKTEMLAAYDDLADDYEWGAKLLGGVEWFGVQMLGQNSVVLRTRIKTRPGDQWAVGRAYSERVKRRFDAAGVEIPFPQLRLWTKPDEDRPTQPVGPITPAARSHSSDPTDADVPADDGPDGGEAR